MIAWPGSSPAWLPKPRTRRARWRLRRVRPPAHARARPRRVAPSTTLVRDACERRRRSASRPAPRSKPAGSWRGKLRSSSGLPAGGGGGPRRGRGGGRGRPAAPATGGLAEAADVARRALSGTSAELAAARDADAAAADALAALEAAETDEGRGLAPPA